MTITKTTASFNTERFEVFRITCVRSEEGGFMPVDVYVALDNVSYDEPSPEPSCMVTIRDWDTWVERSNPDECFWSYRTIEWDYVPKELRRMGIATEVILAIQDHIRQEILRGHW